MSPEHPCQQAPFVELNPVEEYVTSLQLSADGHAYARIAYPPDAWFAAFTQGSDFDPVLLLRRENGDLLASVDESFPLLSSLGRNPLLQFQTGSEPAYCLDVVDWRVWIGMTTKVAQGSLELVSFSLERESAMMNLVDIEVEPNDDVASAQDVRNNRSLLGQHEMPNDVDVYRIPAPAAGGILITVSPEGTGASGYSGFGTESGSVLSILDADATTVLSRVTLADLSAACATGDECDLVPEIPAGASEVFMRFEGPASPSVRANYVAFVAPYPTFGVAEADDDEVDNVNDDAGLALDVELGWFRGRLHDASDVDWWLVGVPDTNGADLAVRCRARTMGSGIEGLTAELYPVGSEGSGAPSDQQTETIDTAIEWGPVPSAQKPSLSGTTRYLLKISSSGSDTSIASRNYECWARTFLLSQ